MSATNSTGRAYHLLLMTSRSRVGSRRNRQAVNGTQLLITRRAGLFILPRFRFSKPYCLSTDLETTRKVSWRVGPESGRQDGYQTFSGWSPRPRRRIAAHAGPRMTAGRNRNEFDAASTNAAVGTAKRWGKPVPHILRHAIDLTPMRSYISGMKTQQLDNVVPPVSFRHFLQGELVRRCARNRQYSLRAFAKFLGIDHSTLSQLLRGKRRLTERSVRRCGMRLGLDEESVLEFIRGESREAKPEDVALGEVRRLASDTAILVADWEHYA